MRVLHNLKLTSKAAVVKSEIKVYVKISTGATNRIFFSLCFQLGFERSLSLNAYIDYHFHYIAKVHILL